MLVYYSIWVMHFARLGFRACIHTYVQHTRKRFLHHRWTESPRTHFASNCKCGEARIIRGLVQIKAECRVMYSLWITDVVLRETTILRTVWPFPRLSSSLRFIYACKNRAVNRERCGRDQRRETQIKVFAHQWVFLFNWHGKPIFYAQRASKATKMTKASFLRDRISALLGERKKQWESGKIKKVGRNRLY